MIDSGTSRGEAHPVPAQVDLVRAEQVLEIVWEDGHRSRYEAAGLRWACPCAGCRGEMGASGRLDHIAELPPKETEVTHVALVGRYALQITFASGHGTGIYTFGYLRGLCRCSECDPMR